MAIEIWQVNPFFVAEIGGIDLSETVDRPAVDAIWQAIDRSAVLVFRNQRLDDTQLRDFAANFGALEIGRAAARGGRWRLAHPEIGDISNLDEDGRLRERHDRRRLDSLGNRLRHTDASYMPVPVVLGMFHAVAVPPASAWAAARPSSPICAQPMTPCPRRWRSL
jgi:alpha-ketoglutarate-dependent 2,4-dichlorophenoxyacetate dioxygenase